MSVKDYKEYNVYVVCSNHFHGRSAKTHISCNYNDINKAYNVAHFYNRNRLSGDMCDTYLVEENGSRYLTTIQVQEPSTIHQKEEQVIGKLFRDLLVGFEGAPNTPKTQAQIQHQINSALRSLQDQGSDGKLLNDFVRRLNIK